MVPDLRAEFPVTERVAFLNHANVSPLSKRARDRLHQWTDDIATNGDRNIDRWFEESRAWSVWQSVYLLRRSLGEPDFSMPSFSRLYRRLQSAGLEPISREEIPYGSWLMIQARKTA